MNKEQRYVVVTAIFVFLSWGAGVVCVGLQSPEAVSVVLFIMVSFAALAALGFSRLFVLFAHNDDDDDDGEEKG